MTEDEIIEKLRNIFKLVNNKKIDTSNIRLESNIIKDLGLDSVGLIYMAIAIEKTFEIDMGNVTLKTFETVNNVVKFIKERIEQ